MPHWWWLFRVPTPTKKCGGISGCINIFMESVNVLNSFPANWVPWHCSLEHPHPTCEICRRWENSCRPNRKRYLYRIAKYQVQSRVSVNRRRWFYLTLILDVLSDYLTNKFNYNLKCGGVILTVPVGGIDAPIHTICDLNFSKNYFKSTRRRPNFSRKR